MTRPNRARIAFRVVILTASILGLAIALLSATTTPAAEERFVPADDPYPTMRLVQPDAISNRQVLIRGESILSTPERSERVLGAVHSNSALPDYPAILSPPAPPKHQSFASVGNAGNDQEKVSDTTMAVVLDNAAEAANLVVCSFASDNSSASDGDNNELTSVTDTGGNTWVQAIESTNGQGGAGSGVTIALFYSVLTTTLAVGNTITANYVSAITAKAGTCWEFTLAASSITVNGTATINNDGADCGIIDLAAQADNVSRLTVRASGAESATTTYTADADYTTFTHTDATTAGGGAATNMGARGEQRIAVETDPPASDPTCSGAVDHASVAFTAIEGCGTNRFWVGGTGNWNDTARWSNTTGGPGGCAVPTASNIVRIDAASCPAACTITVNVNAAMLEFNTTGFDDAGSTLSVGTFNFAVSGDVILGASQILMTIGASAGTGFTMSSAASVLTMSGGAIGCGVSACTGDVNGNVNISSALSYIDFGDATWTFSAAWTNESTTASWDAGTATQLFDSTVNVTITVAPAALGESEFNDVLFSSAAAGSVTFALESTGRTLRAATSIVIRDTAGSTTILDTGSAANVGLTGGSLQLTHGGPSSGGIGALIARASAVSVTTVSIGTAASPGSYVDLGSSAWTVTSTWTNNTTSASWAAGTSTVTLTSATGGTMTFAGTNLAEDEFNAATFTSSAASPQTFTMATRGIRAATATVSDGTSTTTLTTSNLNVVAATINILAGGTLDCGTGDLLSVVTLNVVGSLVMDGFAVAAFNGATDSGTIGWTAWSAYNAATPSIRWTFNPSAAGATVTLTVGGLAANTDFTLLRDNAAIQTATSNGAGTVIFAVLGGWSSHDMEIGLPVPVGGDGGGGNRRVVVLCALSWLSQAINCEDRSSYISANIMSVKWYVDGELRQTTGTNAVVYLATRDSFFDARNSVRHEVIMEVRLINGGRQPNSFELTADYSPRLFLFAGIAAVFVVALLLAVRRTTTQSVSFPRITNPSYRRTAIAVDEYPRGWVSYRQRDPDKYSSFRTKVIRKRNPRTIAVFGLRPATPAERKRTGRSRIAELQTVREKIPRRKAAR